ncbi:MAG: hypothetical protein KA383_12360 [Phycisphaerae bacterium]|nr:hypothetical protein [Phycisphaerae bacterium]
MKEAIGHVVFEIRRGEGLATMTIWTDGSEMTVSVLPEALQALSLGLGEMAGQDEGYRAYVADIFTNPDLPDDTPEPEPADGGLSLID